MITLSLDIDCWLIFSSNEPKPLEVSITLDVPSSWSLLEVIQDLHDILHMLLFTFHLKSSMFLYINLLIQIAIQECTFYIYVVYIPLLLGCH